MVKKKKTFFDRLIAPFRFSDEAVESSIKSPIIHRRPMGSSGTASFSGYPDEEYLSALKGTARADIFDQMRRSDYQVRMLLNAVKNPIKAAVWEVEPADSDVMPDREAADADAALIRHVLFNDMDRPFEDFLSEAMSVVDFGHAVFEVTQKIVIGHPRFGTYNGIQSLGFRSQRTIEKWNLDPETGKLVSIQQQAYGDLDRFIDIPSEFLLVMSLEKEGSNYEGISLLRSCYGPWKRKDLYLKLNAIGIEKFAVPTPIASVPDGEQSGDQYNNLIEVLESYTSHEKAYITKPVGWELTLQQSVYDPEKVEVSIDNEDKRMAKNFLAGFLELGMNGFGSQSLSVDLSDFFLSGLDHIANIPAGVINQNLIPNIIRMNRGERPAYPKLKHSGISDKAGKELMEVLRGFAESKFITPEDADEDTLRKRYGLMKRTGQGARLVQPTQPQLSGTPTLVDRIRLADQKRVGRG